MSVRATSLDDLDLSGDCSVHEASTQDGHEQEDGHALPLTVEIPGKPPSLNAFYSGMHWSKRKKTRDKWHEKVGLLAPDVTIDEYPVAVSCVVYWGEGRRYDAENLAAGSKLITDGLVEAGVLRGDGPKEIRRVTLEARRMDGDGHLTRYTITEA
jgi:hypothetical protein